MSQLLTRQSRSVALFFALALAGALGACRSSKPPERAAANGVVSVTVPRGGELTVSVRSEPKSFNRHVSRDSTTILVSNLMQDRLVRINQATQAVDPGLAEAWTASEDGRRYILTLRRDVVFSDGQPFTADDVLFSFQAAYDERSGSMLGDTVMAGGKKLSVT